MLKKQSVKPLTMEITVISAQGLKNSSSFSRRLRPFITITTFPPTTNGDKHCHVYTTRVDDSGGINPTWGDKFSIPLDSAFFSNRFSSILLQLYTKRFIAGPTQLGWCQIPAVDIGISTATDSVRYLSYRLRDKDGSRGQGIVNLAVKVEGLAPLAGHQNLSRSPELETCHTVIGIPVTLFPTIGNSRDECQRHLSC